MLRPAELLTRIDQNEPDDRSEARRRARMLIHPAPDCPGLGGTHGFGENGNRQDIHRLPPESLNPLLSSTPRQLTPSLYYLSYTIYLGRTHGNLDNSVSLKPLDPESTPGDSGYLY
ncbi:hypothetical protein CIB48_g8827 [Xylaria polymorpha]|nr:hypothetical protein CIB48_g8827 [Xylaria polymorpha]